MGVVVVVQDLREVAALRDRLVTSGRLAAVGQLAAGIAHEINNPLAFVRSNLCHLRREWAALESETAKPQAAPAAFFVDWGELLEESREGVDRATTIVRDVRELSHAGAATPELVDAHAILDQVLHVARSELAPDVRVETDYVDNGLLLCEPQRLKQVFLNLVVNAGQAIGPAGRIRVSPRSDERYIPPSWKTTAAECRRTCESASSIPSSPRSRLDGAPGWVSRSPTKSEEPRRRDLVRKPTRGRGSALHVRLPRRMWAGRAGTSPLSQIVP
ncbi:MAG TPA: histidine kinase dimerization/phospho-acceptor domain-containing protein [Myxococcota bacterium]|nr:histidine kinase dimerization/phospho-acceptor domain-containing protein [Myxococcota bacterium]